PTLLKATNASFAALQLVLFALLLATYNIHCFILSVLCAGLWASVNWFAAELAVAQREQREKEQREKRDTAAANDGDGDGDGDGDDDSATEVESSAPSRAPPAVAATTSDVAAAAGLEPLEPKGEVKHRAGNGTQSSVSTEDEWEKVSEAENEKDK
ncbi:hypothetical protein FZEAL_9637, partial [Fusarium zealandicum]